MAKGRIQLAPQEKMLQEIHNLQSRLQFVEETLRAIHSAEVDAIIMSTENGERVFTFEEAERPYRILIEDMSQGAVCLDRSGTILYCNKFFEELIGSSSGTLIGAQFTSVVDREDRSIWETAWESFPPKGESVRLMNQNGERIPCRICPSRLKLKGEMDVGLIVTDLREQLRAEELLRQKYKEAEAANRMKDIFLATVSHELRTPLNIIGGHARLLFDEVPGSPEFIESLESILRNVDTQTRLVEDILDTSRIMSGKIQLQKKAIDLNTLLQDIVNSFSILASDKKIRIDLQSPKEPVIAEVDPDRLRQATHNLLSNAIKFTPEGGLVRVDLERGCRELRISVSDSGIGISEKFLPKIFDQFSQEDSSTTREHGGLGLGLSITRHLIEAHGGSIRATSAGKGSGAKFTICLPPSFSEQRRSDSELHS